MYDNAIPDFDGYNLRADGGSVTVIRRQSFARRSRSEAGKRSTITQFSSASRTRMLRQLRQAQFGFYPKGFFTLTYPSQWSNDGRIIKSHFKRFLDRLQRKFPRARIFWFLEFQDRGAPHFHFFSTRLFKRGYIPRLWDWATNGDGGFVYQQKIKFNHHKFALWYASKYSAKCEQKIVPENYLSVGRFWGWRNCPPLVSATTSVDWRTSSPEAWELIIELLNYLKKEFTVRFSSNDISYCLEYYRIELEQISDVRFLYWEIKQLGGRVANADCLC